MKEIMGMPARSILPKELLNLPQPWGMTHADERRQQLGLISYEFNSIKTALNVLERSLHALSLLTYNKNNCIPKEMLTYWDFSAQWLAERIPTFDELNYSKVEEYLINDEMINSPPPELIFDVADYWIWWVTRGIKGAALRWVESALYKTREPILISRYLLIVSRYWQKIEPRFVQSLVGASSMIAWQKALPLFYRIEQHPNAAEAVKDTVRNYREFILQNPEDWLPDSDVDLEWSDKKAVFVPTHPVLGQLAAV